jgi:hypothetical protein
MTIKYRLIRLWETLRYDLPRFIKNIWQFRKALWQFRWYDRHGLYVFMNTSIGIMADKTEKYGMEIDYSRLKKVAKMKRAAELLQNFIDDNFVDQAEAELGKLIIYPIEWKPSETHADCYELVDNDTPEERNHNSKVFDRAREIQSEQWIELMDILKGQDIKKFKPKTMKWEEWYDGSGAQNWWD